MIFIFSPATPQTRRGVHSLGRLFIQYAMGFLSWRRGGLLRERGCARPIPFASSLPRAKCMTVCRSTSCSLTPSASSGGYDSDRFRARIAKAGGAAVIPSTRSRSQAIPYARDIYQERNLIERFFNMIKHFRRIAPRYAKTALSVASMPFLAGGVIWRR